MKLISQVSEVHEFIDEYRAQKNTIGLVPTMGFLHEGHISLMQRAANENDKTIVTIFVNPLQFAEGEDLSSYPQNLEKDINECEAIGVDLLFIPSSEEMYSQPILTSVQVDQLMSTIEGASRPTHFSGVATVVAKLFNIVGPCNAYFGEKDWQQLQVISTMARDLSFRVKVLGCPTVRQSDGLALSSRNAYLTPEEREAATVISRSLQVASENVQAGETSASVIKSQIVDEMTAETLATLDYVEIVEGSSLQTIDQITEGARILIAAKVGKARLIDNVNPYFGIK
ncbi:MAG TPA: pantoate--beta-alanine ligase [Acidimicrobiaceae bacterium]|nr:pantoate--beta-alanine ligase [Acidimicrobiaceae bacterium]|tara:strand:+ start:299 stop:1153 length:855 start_codon:yes stop_codon:yes gene_type:complete